MDKIEFVGKCLLIREKKKKILVVGDLHIGYEESLNLSGVFVGRKMFEEMIKYFEVVFERVGKADYVVLLGDVKHEFGSVLKQEWKEVLEFFDYVGRKLKRRGRILIVRGNHDKILEPIVKKRTKIKMRDFFVVEKFCFVHGDKIIWDNFVKKTEVWVMGHGHPAVKISDGVKTEKYKCFLVGKWFDKKVIILPSFFSGNEGSDPRENDLGLAWSFDLENFEVFVVGEGLEVLNFGKLAEL